MDVIFDWNLGNMIYNGLITLRLCGFPFVEIRSLQRWFGMDGWWMDMDGVGVNVLKIGNYYY